VDIVGSFEAAALSAPLAMSTNGHQGFDTHTRENLWIHANRGGSPATASYATVKRRPPEYAQEAWRERLSAACAAHARPGAGQLEHYMSSGRDT
jgi:hypothetical protein